MENLYQEAVLKHNRAPYHLQTPAQICCEMQGYNATCGDRLTVYLNCDEYRRAQIFYTGEACAVCIAAASMMASGLEGLTPAQMRAIGGQFIAALEDGAGLDAPSAVRSLLQPLLTVRQFPGRIGCATLPWRALLRALKCDIPPPLSGTRCSCLTP